MAKSQSKKATCFKCGSALTGVRLHGESVVLSDNAAIHIERHFIGACPTHGEVRVNAAGHHSTLLESTLRRHLTLEDRRRIRTRLSVAERRNFRAAEKGKYKPTREEISRWRALLK